MVTIFTEEGIRNVDYPLEKVHNKKEARGDLELKGQGKFIGFFLRIREIEHCVGK